jgi:hypothetical protein
MEFLLAPSRAEGVAMRPFVILACLLAFIPCAAWAETPGGEFDREAAIREQDAYWAAEAAREKTFLALEQRLADELADTSPDPGAARSLFMMEMVAWDKSYDANTHMLFPAYNPMHAYGSGMDYYTTTCWHEGMDARLAQLRGMNATETASEACDKLSAIRENKALTVSMVRRLGGWHKKFARALTGSEKAWNVWLAAWLTAWDSVHPQATNEERCTAEEQVTRARVDFLMQWLTPRMQDVEGGRDEWECTVGVSDIQEGPDGDFAREDKPFVMPSRRPSKPR